MKKQVTDYVKSIGGETAYSGKTKTMYIISDPHPFDNDIEKKVLLKFGYSLPFKLATN